MDDRLPVAVLLKTSVESERLGGWITNAFAEVVGILSVGEGSHWLVNLLAVELTSYEPRTVEASSNFLLDAVFLLALTSFAELRPLSAEDTDVLFGLGLEIDGCFPVVVCTKMSVLLEVGVGRAPIILCVLVTEAELIVLLFNAGVVDVLCETSDLFLWYVSGCTFCVLGVSCTLCVLEVLCTLCVLKVSCSFDSEAACCLISLFKSFCSLLKSRLAVFLTL